MANPILNEKAAAEAARAGWAAPDPSTARGPITDGPVSAWAPAGTTMTVSGTATATGVLLVLLLVTATIGWVTTDPLVDGFPGLALGGAIVGLVCGLVVSFKPTLARVLGPVYALAEGYFLGVISRAYDTMYDGIVLQAVGATLGVFAVMLVLYRTQIIKVTQRFRRIVLGAMMGLMLFYLVSWIVSLFAGRDAVSFMNSSSNFGILISVVAAGLAAMMLAIDFDLIERGAREGWPKGMEWYGAFGLLTTLVWLYLEMLRLLAKLQDRR